MDIACRSILGRLGRQRAIRYAALLTFPQDHRGDDCRSYRLANQKHHRLLAIGAQKRAYRWREGLPERPEARQAVATDPRDPLRSR